MVMDELSKRFEDALALLRRVGQEHLLTFYPQLDDNQRAELLNQIHVHDWSRLSELIDKYVRQDGIAPLPRDIEPAPYYPANPDARLKNKYIEARHLGEKLIRQGKVAAFTVAGGQGTRLGWDGPKGTFPATPIHHKPLFQVFAEFVARTRRKYAANVPWYVMTSPENDSATREFFEKHNYFAIEPEDVTFFPQGTIPSFSLNGKALLEAPCRLAVNPDGHGGSLKALYQSGAITDMKKRGIEQISYFQVDNPLVRCIDPLFIGLHALDQAQMSSKMVPKSHAGEKVGVFARWEGKLGVIEYSDLPAELAEAKGSDGSLRFVAGSIAIHIIAVSFVEKLNARGFALPYHRALKKIPHIDLSTGRRVEPDRPNGAKLETFVFDALRLCDRSMVLETVREEEFGPIKNAQGPDSADSSRKLQSDRAGRWLESVGVRVPRDGEGYNATLEISPLTAIEPADLRQSHLPKTIQPGQTVAI
jgi:UDP-N-acetylglucosamine/UDP-N-acetylgalactosamine diphosphorylase